MHAIYGLHILNYDIIKLFTACIKYYYHYIVILIISFNNVVFISLRPRGIRPWGNISL